MIRYTWVASAVKTQLAADQQQSLGRAVQPGDHPGQRPDGQGDRHQRHGEPGPEVASPDRNTSARIKRID
jgi:hypothetical protein